MYQVFCMQDTPPVTWEEQDKCLHSKHGCWRLADQKEAEPKEPASTRKRSAHSTSSSSTTL